MISQPSAKYQLGVIDTADTTDGNATNLALLSAESEKVYRLYLPGKHIDVLLNIDRSSKFYVTRFASQGR